MDQKLFHDLVSGQRQGFVASLIRGLLWPASRVYSTVASTRNALYQNGILRSYKAPCPVICVGNLTTGGTGKTPLVAWVCRYLTQERHLKATVLTRGYKSSHTQTDEPAMLEQQLGNIPVIVNGDRIQGTKTAIANGPVDVFVMDDGFQHQQLARDLNILTLDATNPFGYGKLLPAGSLREPVTAMKRAQCVVITRSDQISELAFKSLTSRLKCIHPKIVVASTVHAPTKVHFSDHTTHPASWLKERSVFAFCGIGNPKAFFTTLKGLNVKLTGTQTFDDHYHCTQADFENLKKKALESQADLLLTTEKNYPDIATFHPSKALSVGYLAIELAFESGENCVKELIEQALASRISQS